ncbi:hypothetical protein V5O48_013866 [Marasmius crinis-equi]|uniref:Uncharacterized protein n=1 Tax=Marasmius crinis-equi TaxID=585013 RepID=A0ABR3EYW8_9AGAR
MKVRLKIPARIKTKIKSIIVPGTPSFSFKRALRHCVENEARLGHLDHPPLVEDTVFCEDEDTASWEDAASLASSAHPLSPLSSLTSLSSLNSDLTPLSSASSLSLTLSETHNCPSSPQASPSRPNVAPTACQKRNRRNKDKGHRNRERARLQTKGTQDSMDPNIQSSVYEQHVHTSTPDAVSYSFAQSAPVCSTGFICCDDNVQFTEPFWLHELCGPHSRFKLREIMWNGRTAIPILDEDGRIITLLAGRPRSRKWSRLATEAAALLEILRPRCNFFNSKGPNRRGEFGAINVGISYGGGQTTWQLRMHGTYRNTIRTLLDHDEDLSLPFDNSVFTCTAFNFGPHTECVHHLDHSNYPPGWCAIWSLGKFNLKRGGHLVLRDLGIAVRFPPGSLILVPSASCRHENTRIGEQETQYSFTQFSAGGLFRWVEHEHQPEWRYNEELGELSEDEARIRLERDEARWSSGLALLSTAHELCININEAAIPTGMDSLGDGIPPPHFNIAVLDYIMPLLGTVYLYIASGDTVT